MLIGRESTDHGSDLKVAQFLFFFLRREKGSQNRQCSCKKDKQTNKQTTHRQTFPMVCILMDHRNDVKMFKTQVEPPAAGNTYLPL